jgi:hypothetical protein
MQTLKIDEANDKTIGFGPMDVMKKEPSCFKTLTHFICVSIAFSSLFCYDPT